MKTISRLNQLAAALGGHLQQFEEIPLKSEGSSDCCYPSYADRGPSLYISGRKDSKVYDMPKEGTAKIKFKMRSKGVDYRDNGEETFRTDIEVESIEPVNLEAIVQGYQFADRARDNGGRFAPGNNVSTGDMADAYVNPEKRKKRTALLAGAGVAGVTAAVAGRKAIPGVSQGVGRILRGAL